MSLSKNSICFTVNKFYLYSVLVESLLVPKVFNKIADFHVWSLSLEETQFPTSSFILFTKLENSGKNVAYLQFKHPHTLVENFKCIFEPVNSV